MLAARPSLAAHLERVSGFIERHPIATVFLMRFAWGFRSSSCGRAGMTMSAALFVALDAVAAVLQARAVARFGLEVAGVVHGLMSHVRHHEHLIVFGALALA